MGELLRNHRLWEDPDTLEHSNSHLWESKQGWMMEMIGGRDRAPAPAFKAPKYNSTGDVEYFIDQFNEVAEANGWDDASTLILLKERLKDEARECGRSPTIQGVEDRLKTRFGLTPREARAKLALCNKAPKPCNNMQMIFLSWYKGDMWS